MKKQGCLLLIAAITVLGLLIYAVLVANGG